MRGATRRRVQRGRRTHGHGRRVVHEATESPLAELLIVAGIEDEFVPQVIDDLRRHRDELPAAQQMRPEELPQGARHRVGVCGREAGMPCTKLVEQTWGGH